MDSVIVLVIALLFILTGIAAVCWANCIFLGFTSKNKVEDNVLKDEVEHAYDISNVGEPFVTLRKLLESRPEKWDWWRDGLKYCKGGKDIKLSLSFEYCNGIVWAEKVYSLYVESKCIRPTPDEELYVKEQVNAWLKIRLEEDKIKEEKQKSAERYKALKELQEEICG